MKAIMISIRPGWMCRILNGEKLDEIRKGTAIYKAIKKLIKEQGKAILFGYCTKGKPSVAPFHFEEGWFYREYNDGTNYACGCTANMGEDINGKVAVRLEVDAEEIYSDIFQHEYRTNNLNQDKILERSKLSADQLEGYLGKGFGAIGTDIHILSRKIFDNPKKLKEFDRNGSYRSVKNCPKKNRGQCNEGISPFTGEWCGCGKARLTNAPQSWCYCEVEE